MNVMGKRWLKAAGIAVMLVLSSGMARAQYGQSQPAQQQNDKNKMPEAAPLTLDAAAPVNAEEDAAFKAFQDTPQTDSDKRIHLGEAFALKYPESRYRSPVYAGLVMAYVEKGEIEKMETVGDKEIALTPNDVQTLAIMGSTLPRAINPSTPEPNKRLAKAEQYSLKAIEVTPTIAKPEKLTDEQFTLAKNQTLAMAHGGLGLVDFRRGKFAEAIKEFDQSVKLDPSPMPDPVSFYLLGVCNERASHFDDAVAAFTKCAAIPGSLQGTCKTGIEEAKKLSATQLSAPK
jgi:tetratricopeptide (TPR) repeat protein